MVATVVTFTFQLGSGGFAISRQVAEHLGYHYFDWDVTSEAARLAGVTPEAMAASERVPGFFERMVSRLFPASLLTPEEGAVVMQAEAEVMDAAVQGLSSENYRGVIEQVVKEIASRGDAVIVGHGAAAILRGQGNVLRVLIHGSQEKRVARLVQEQNLSRDAAERTIRQSDKDRHELFSVAYKLSWLDATNYDFAFNSDQMPEESAIAAIVAAAKTQQTAELAMP
jgi:cytidylate kinase